MGVDHECHEWARMTCRVVGASGLGGRGTPYGVLCYGFGYRGYREWLAGPPATNRSSLRDGVGVEGASELGERDRGFGLRGHRQDARATLVGADGARDDLLVDGFSLGTGLW